MKTVLFLLDIYIYIQVQEFDVALPLCNFLLPIVYTVTVNAQRGSRH
jgi:hypothetical protein